MENVGVVTVDKTVVKGVKQNYNLLVKEKKMSHHLCMQYAPKESYNN